MSNRVIILVFGPVVAYFAIYLGDGGHVYMAKGFAETPIPFPTFLLMVVTFFATFGGLALLSVCVELAFDAEKRYSRQPAGNRAVTSAMTLVMLCGSFGLLAGPFTNYGPFPWYWASRWDIIPVLAMIPYVMALRELIADIVACRRQKQQANKDSVTTFRRPGE